MALKRGTQKALKSFLSIILSIERLQLSWFRLYCFLFYHIIFIFYYTVQTETHFFRVLYNSGMKFKERLYVSLDVDLTRIRLHQPISNIVKQPFLYVRDMLPRNCFLAVTKLHEVCLSSFSTKKNEGIFF